MSDKNIKVLFLKKYDNLELKLTKNIWLTIENNLRKKNYNFIHYYNDNQNLTDEQFWIETFEKINEGKFDVVVLPYNNFRHSIYVNRNNNVEFTNRLFLEKRFILYKETDEYKKTKLILYKDLFKLWIIFIILMMIISFLLFFIYTNIIVNYKHKYHNYFFSLLGSDKNLLNNIKTFDFPTCTFFIILCLIIYLINLSFNSLTFSKSATFIKPTETINREIIDKKILIPEDIFLKNFLKKSGANPITTRNNGIYLLKEYIKKYKNLDGVVIDPVYFKGYEIKDNKVIFSGLNEYFIISSFNLGYRSFTLPINKKKKKIL